MVPSVLSFRKYRIKIQLYISSLKVEVWVE